MVVTKSHFCHCSHKTGAYIFFNFAVVFVCSWLYLGGLRKVKSALSPAARKHKKQETGQQKQNGSAA